MKSNRTCFGVKSKRRAQQCRLGVDISLSDIYLKSAVPDDLIDSVGEELPFFEAALELCPAFGGDGVDPPLSVLANGFQSAFEPAAPGHGGQ